MFALDADIPALLRKCASEALGGQLDFEQDVSSLRKHGANAPPRVNEMGHAVLRVVEFGRGPPRPDQGPNLAASHFESSSLGKRPDLLDGGFHLPPAEGGLLRSGPPKGRRPVQQ